MIHHSRVLCRVNKEGRPGGKTIEVLKSNVCISLVSVKISVRIVPLNWSRDIVANPIPSAKFDSRI